MTKLRLFPINSATPARIMIVDDHPIVRDGIAVLLTGHANLVVSSSVENIEQALREIGTNPPDVVIVDLSLKEENGLELIRRIKQQNKSIRILVVSMHDEKLFGERAMDLGAMGYLNKQVASRKIVDAIQQILNGELYISDDLAAQMEFQRLREPDSPRTSGVESLTERELDVFSKIGEGLTTVQVAAKMHLSVKTIESHRQKIKAKLGLKNSAELMREATRWLLLNRGPDARGETSGIFGTVK